MASEQKSAAGDNIGPGSSNVNSSKSSKDDPKYSDISDAADGAGTSHKKDRGGKSSEGKHSKPILKEGLRETEVSREIKIVILFH